MVGLIRIQLLGQLQLTTGGKVITTFRSKKVAELLAYLSLHREKMCSREQLASTLWPDEYDDTTRLNRLSNALSHIRTYVEPPGVDRGTVLETNRLFAFLRRERIEVDLLLFKEAIRACANASDLDAKMEHCLRAFQLYGGDFASPLDSDWIFAERIRLQDDYALLLADLRTTTEQAGNLDQAIEYGKLLWKLDEYSEAAHAEMIRLYLLAGLEQAAQDQLQTLRTILKEMDASPSPLTLDLFESVRPVRPPKGGFQGRDLIAEQWPRETATTRPSHERKPSLPFHITRFFGRESEISTVREVLLSPGTRLITLVGTGGCGKTRLSIEIARGVLDEFGGGVYFVGLADVTDPAFIGDAILSALGQIRTSATSAVDEVQGALADFPATLLLFDNVEHLIEHVVPIIQELLFLAPGLKIIATSRVHLNLSGECEIPVTPLPCPTEDMDAAALGENASVALFLDRAKAVYVDFHLAPRNASAIIDLCRQLDGIPLAIELAATWARTLTPQQMLQQLSRRFDFLVTRRRDVPVRHQKMIALIETSYMQLEPPARRFLAELSVFQGGWSLEAAAEICYGENALHLHRELLERTLITSSYLEGGDTPRMRYNMLESIKEFVAARLAPEEQESLRQIHADYFLANIEKMALEDGAWAYEADISDFANDLNNYRAAVDWLISTGQAAKCINLLFLTRSAWSFLGLHDEVTRYIEALESSATSNEIDLPTQGRFLCLKAKFWSKAKFWDPDVALPALVEAVAVHKQVGDSLGIAVSLLGLAIWQVQIGLLEDAKKTYAEVSDYVKASGSSFALSRYKSGYATLLDWLGDFEQARVYYREAIQSACKYDNIVRNWIQLAETETKCGNFDAAEECGYEALREIRRCPDVVVEPLIHYIFGIAAFNRNQFEVAWKHYVDGAKLIKRHRNQTYLGFSLVRLAALAHALGEETVALIFLAAAKGPGRWKFTRDLWEERGAGVHPDDVGENLTDREKRQAASTGAAMDFVAAIDFALSWKPEF